jgi:hypothetical protein
MSGHISPVLSESFEDVLNAVQETARGRWFLEEYATRKKSEDTASILAAIVKLESVMARVPQAERDAEPALLDLAKSAILRAKAQIRSMAPVDSPLSHEAQLFAKLADLSRTAFAESEDDQGKQALGRSMEVALRLVNELDQSLGINEKPEPQVSQKFFHRDSDIFEPVAKEAPAPETSQRGAKLTITRSFSAPMNTVGQDVSSVIDLQSDTIDTNQVEVTSQPVSVHEEPAVATAAEQKPEQRIVIIRRKPDEAIDVPLFDKQENAA